MNKTENNICSNCNENNPLYSKNCFKCKHYLRTAVINIDLWLTVWKLFESPKIAIKNIIYAEHKNFLVILFFLFSIKLLFTSIIIQNESISGSFGLYNFATIIAIYFVSILVITKIITIFFNSKIKTRFKDNLSIIIFAHAPAILTLLILTPVEASIFGSHWLLGNPSPFLIKANIAYVLAFLEIIMILWSFIILFKGFLIQSNSKSKALISFGLFIGSIVSIVNFIPYILF